MKNVCRLSRGPQTLEGGLGGCRETRTYEMFHYPTDNLVVTPPCGAIWSGMWHNSGIALNVCHEDEGGGSSNFVNIINKATKKTFILAILGRF